MIFQNLRFTLRTNIVIAVVFSAFTTIGGPVAAGTPLKSESAVHTHTEPFHIKYKVQESTGASFTQYFWSNGAGRFRIENELPYSIVDGVTDVTIEDYSQHKRFIVNTNYQAVEVQSLDRSKIPLSDGELVRELNAKCIGQKKIAGFQCKGWRFGEGNEVWISPELGWYLEFRSTSPSGTVVCSAQTVEHRNQLAETFALPTRYKYVNFNEESHHHSHSHTD